MTDEAIIERWETAVRGFRSLAKGARLAELRGDYRKRFDDRGMHPLSVEYGRILALQELAPALRDNDFDPVREANQARTEALAEFAEQIIEEGGVPDGPTKTHDR